MEKKLFGNVKGGIYALKVDGVIVYVGKTKEFEVRMSQHRKRILSYANGTYHKETKKYKYLFEHINEITWDVLSNVNTSEEEYKYIAMHDPILNEQRCAHDPKEYKRLWREKKRIESGIPKKVKRFANKNEYMKWYNAQQKSKDNHKKYRDSDKYKATRKAYRAKKKLEDSKA